MWAWVTYLNKYCSPPDSSAHGIIWARILEWVHIPFSRGYFQPRDGTQVSCIACRFFIIWATRVAQKKYYLTPTVDPSPLHFTFPFHFLEQKHFKGTLLRLWSKKKKERVWSKYPQHVGFYLGACRKFSCLTGNLLKKKIIFIYLFGCTGS